MTIEAIINFGIQSALVVLVISLVISSYRVWVGPSPADRLQAADAGTTILIGIIIVLALVQGTPMLIDVGVALAALSFVGTLAVSRYLAEGKVF
jgi:multisubunit Na+/H+ antiporter MnhF subunit